MTCLFFSTVSFAQKVPYRYVRPYHVHYYPHPIYSYGLPYVAIPYGGYIYRYQQGCFYRPYGSVYQVVPAPFGIQISTLPYGYMSFYIGPNPYYYFNGIFYKPHANQYEVVAPPLGAVVNAANAHLATGGGVTGALVKSVGGSQPWNKLMKTAKNINDQSQTVLNVGDAVYTSTAGQLKTDKVQFIIHTLGPVAGSDDISLVQLSIFNTLALADHLQIKSLVLPAISGGIFAAGQPGWATQVRQLILEAIDKYMNTQPTKIGKIYIISYDLNDKSLWLSV